MATVETSAGGRNPLTKYIADLADSLELRDWRIVLHPEAAEVDNAAQIMITEGRKLAILQLGENFHEEPVAEQRHVLCHELLHCHTASACHACEHDLLPFMGGIAHEVFFAAFTREMEYGNDALTTVIAKHMPLPPKG